MRTPENETNESVEKNRRPLFQSPLHVYMNTFHTAIALLISSLAAQAELSKPVATTPVPMTPVPVTPVPSTPVPSNWVPPTPVPATPMPAAPVPSASEQAARKVRKNALKLTDSDFVRLITEVKTLQKLDHKTYLRSDLAPYLKALHPLSPTLAVVRRNCVEFFLTADLEAPVILVFSRFVGIWSPHAVLWAVDLKGVEEAEDPRIWSTKESLSEQEAKIEWQLQSLESPTPTKPEPQSR